MSGDKLERIGDALIIATEVAAAAAAMLATFQSVATAIGAASAEGRDLNDAEWARVQAAMTGADASFARELERRRREGGRRDMGGGFDTAPPGGGGNA